MKYAHNVKISVFVNPEDDETKIKDALKNLVPIDFNPETLKNEKIEFTRTVASGFNEKRIIILELTLQKDKSINDFIKHLCAALDQSTRNMILNQKNRLDDNLYFYLRLDKEKLINNLFEIVDHGNCYHIKMSVAAFPRTKEAGWRVVEKMFT